MFQRNVTVEENSKRARWFSFGTCNTNVPHYTPRYIGAVHNRRPAANAVGYR